MINGVDVDNIDAFQGQEREVLILNTVRCNSVDRIGFLDDYRRVNVSLTRAKRALFILGSASTLHRGGSYGGWGSLLSQLSTEQAIFNVRLQGDKLKTAPRHEKWDNPSVLPMG